MRCTESQERFTPLDVVVTTFDIVKKISVLCFVSWKCSTIIYNNLAYIYIYGCMSSSMLIIVVLPHKLRILCNRFILFYKISSVHSRSSIIPPFNHQYARGAAVVLRRRMRRTYWSSYWSTSYVGSSTCCRMEGHNQDSLLVEENNMILCDNDNDEDKNNNSLLLPLVLKTCNTLCHVIFFAANFETGKNHLGSFSILKGYFRHIY